MKREEKGGGLCREAALSMHPILELTVLPLSSGSKGVGKCHFAVYWGEEMGTGQYSASLHHPKQSGNAAE